MKNVSTLPSTAIAALLLAWSGAARASQGDAQNCETPKEREEPEHVGVGVLGGLSFPRPLALEGMVRIEGTVALGIEYSALPTMTLSGVETRFWALAADARVFPFRSPFFVGLRGGFQHLGASTAVGVGVRGAILEELQMDTLFVNPRLGVLFGSAPGFVVGIEAGVQIPLSASFSSTIPAGFAPAQGVTEFANTIGRGVLPTFDLLRIGVLL